MKANYIIREGKHGTGNTIIAVNSPCGTEIGRLEYSFENNGIYIYQIHVEEKHRGNRIGVKLVERLIDLQRNSGLLISALCSTFNTNMTSNNLIRWWRNRGFKILPKLESDDDGVLCRLSYQL